MVGSVRPAALPAGPAGHRPPLLAGRLAALGRHTLLLKSPDACRYEPHAISFTDMFSTACEAPSLVFFSEQEDVVDTVDPKGMAMTTIVKEFAERGIKARVRTDGKRQPSRNNKMEL